MIFQVKIAILFFLGCSFLSGAAVAPQSASAFVMGAWAGVLLAAPPLMLLAFSLGLLKLRQLLAPLMRLPVLIVLSAVLLYISGVELGTGVQSIVVAATLWWARKGRHLLGL